MKIVYLHFAVKFYEWLQQRQVKKRFYQNPIFRELDEELIRGPNPYRVKEAFPYGETPLCSLKQIADRCNLTADDCVVDLGCGRGRGVFFLADHYGCRVKGVDKIGVFIDRAKALSKKYQTRRVSFTCGDMREFNLDDATCIFFYGTTFGDDFIAMLIRRFLQLKKGTKVVSVSYPLEGLILADQLTVSFPWGKGEVYIQTV
ncbi:MAG TPA: class I SAM-dependent methyltransferase [Rhabdochlamydiaceae bacterium]|nr:class I SAM-dependent methyltransferase [Rhabdochlamydiaceae bacterium]